MNGDEFIKQENNISLQCRIWKFFRGSKQVHHVSRYGLSTISRGGGGESNTWARKVNEKQDSYTTKLKYKRLAPDTCLTTFMKCTIKRLTSNCSYSICKRMRTIGQCHVNSCTCYQLINVNGSMSDVTDQPTCTHGPVLQYIYYWHVSYSLPLPSVSGMHSWPLSHNWTLPPSTVLTQPVLFVYHACENFAYKKGGEGWD